MAGDLPGAVAESVLARLPMVSWNHEEIVDRYLAPSQIFQAAVAADAVKPDDYLGKNGSGPRRSARAALARFTASRGFRSPSELVPVLRAQKLYRAVYSESQLVEVLTHFWFNHFNVSASSHESVVHMLAFERDAIRPRVFGSFRRLLGATARHPAMLLYLNNASSRAPRGAITSLDRVMEMESGRFSPVSNLSYRERVVRALGWQDPSVRLPDSGLNENYARELLELHTLGVDGGYSQQDVVEVARALTGWTAFPPSTVRRYLKALFSDSDKAGELGLLADQEFLFRPDYHDSDEKTILGIAFPAGGGHEEGEAVLDLLAGHASAARYLSTKLAVRFVTEDPPWQVIERLMRTYELTDGDLREMMRTLVVSPEFWRARRAKIKSPFELAASSLRALGAEVSDPAPVIDEIRRMGEPLYAYDAPTGYPDEAEAWTGVGAMLARMNFAFKLTAGKIRGVDLDLLELAGETWPLTRAEAAEFFFPKLLPGVEADSTWAKISVLLDDRESESSKVPKDPRLREIYSRQQAAYAVGLLLASPTFQLR